MINKLGSEFQINTYTNNDQSSPSITRLNDAGEGKEILLGGSQFNQITRFKDPGATDVDNFNLISSTMSSPGLITPVSDSPFSGSGKVLSSVPAYNWYHGCGPTAAASVIGYWDLLGYSNLLDASGDDVFLTENVKDHISSPEHNAKYDPTPDDPNLPVPPFTSIADWFQTSVDPLNYGWSWLSYADDAFTGYTDYRGYDFEAINKSYSSQLWNDLVFEIDSGHPAMFLVDTDGDGGTDHFVPVLGYDDRGSEGQFYGLYTTWSEDESVVWKPFQGLGNSWGVGYATFVRPQPQLSVTNVSPVPNTVSSSLNSEIIIEFDDTISGSANSSEILISSNQRGIISGTFIGGEGSNTITFTPDESLKEGEQISVTITNSIGGSIVEPYNYSFLVEATAGTGSFSDFDRYWINSDVEENHQYSNDVVMADFDNDGDLDLVSANDNQGNRIYFNDGNGTFTDSGQSLLSTNDSEAVAVGDLDRDGDLDLIIANGDDNNVYQTNNIYWNDGNGIFTDSGQSLGGENLDIAVEVGDLDLDGDLDLVFLNNGYDGTGNQIYWNDGTGVFSYSGQSVGSQSGTGMAMGDIDSDGDLDIIITGDNKIDIAINDGTGTFTSSTQSVVDGEDSDEVEIADLDNDGDLDLAVAYERKGNRIFFNDGTGTFIDSNQSLGQHWTNGVAIGDVDSDGDLDLVFANINGSSTVNSVTTYYNGENKVYLNDGTGTFADSGLSLSPYTSSDDVEIADINNDGDLDLIFSYWGQNKVYSNQQLPVAIDDNFTIDEDQVLNGNVLVDNGNGADSDGDGDILTVTANTYPTNGTLTINSNGDFIYTPYANFYGNDSFEYTISDGHSGTDTAIVNLTINSVNDPLEIVNPISDITVITSNYADDTIIDLSEVFYDPDTISIYTSIVSNTNPDLVNAKIVPCLGEICPTVIQPGFLILDYQENEYGTAEITVQAEESGDSVQDTFTVTVLEAPLYITYPEFPFIDNDNSVYNYDYIYSDTSVYNYNHIYNHYYGFVDNYGYFSNDYYGSVENFGYFSNYGTVDNYNSFMNGSYYFTIDNPESLPDGIDCYNDDHALDCYINVVENFGDFYNSGFFSNLDYGTVLNSGYFSNFDIIENYGYFVNDDSVTIDNPDSFSNDDDIPLCCSSAVQNNGFFLNHGYVENNSFFLNQWGDVENFGSFSNGYDGYLDNYGYIHNYGNIYNDGYFHVNLDNFYNIGLLAGSGIFSGELSVGDGIISPGGYDDYYGYGEDTDAVLTVDGNYDQDSSLASIELSLTDLSSYDTLSITNNGSITDGAINLLGLADFRDNSNFVKGLSKFTLIDGDSDNDGIGTLSIDSSVLNPLVDFVNNYDTAKLDLDVILENNELKLVVYNWDDHPPEVINPIPDINVYENASATDIDLAGVFDDVDGDNIDISVYHNTNPDLVVPELIALPCGCNPKLYSFILEYERYQSGIAQITLQAEANGEVVYDDFTVTVAPFNLDIDGDGQCSAAVDGLLTYGYMNVRKLPDPLRENLTQQLADNLINPNGNATRTTGAEIVDYLESNIEYLDIDRDGEISAGIDGLLVYGYMNVRNLPDPLRINLTQQLADNLIPDGSDANRTTGLEIANYLEQFIF